METNVVKASVIGNIVGKLNIFSKKSEKKESISDILRTINDEAAHRASSEKFDFYQTKMLAAPFERGYADYRNKILDEARQFEQTRFDFHRHEMLVAAGLSQLISNIQTNTHD